MRSSCSIPRKAMAATNWCLVFFFFFFVRKWFEVDSTRLHNFAVTVGEKGNNSGGSNLRKPLAGDGVYDEKSTVKIEKCVSILWIEHFDLCITLDLSSLTRTTFNQL